MQYKDNGATITVTLPNVRHSYINNILKLKCLPELMALFSQCGNPAKELTESYAAFHQLRRFNDVYRQVVHVGDGAHCRTGALFALLTKHHNLSIDPIINIPRVDDWRDTYNIKRFKYDKGVIENWEFDDPEMLFTFVHAHVDVDEVLSTNTWRAAYTCACCQHNKQLSKKFRLLKGGEDYCIYSPERKYQVLVWKP